MYSVSNSPTQTPKQDVVIDTVKESTTPTSYIRYSVSISPTQTPSSTISPSQTPKQDVVIDTVKESTTPTSYIRYSVSISPTQTPKQDIVTDNVMESSTPTSYIRYSVSISPTQTPSSTRTPSQTSKQDIIIDNVKESTTPTSYIRYSVSSSPTQTPSSTRTPSRTYYKLTTQTLRGSKSPYPSKRPITSPTQIPTRYPVSTAYIQFIQSKIPSRSPFLRPSIMPSTIPKVINSGISLQGANATALTQPSSLQQLQAALACTLQTPLENIQIMNITYTDSRGLHTAVYDKSIPTLSSNGSVVCLIPKLNTTSNGRRLQDAVNPIVDSTVIVDYAIINPSIEIISSSVDSFIDIVSSSQILIDVTASIGATNIDTIVPLELFSYSAASAPEQLPPQASEDKTSLYMGVGLCVLGISGIAATVAVVIMNKRKKIHTPLTHVVRVIEMNPVMNKAIAETSFRTIQLPNQVRK